MVKLSVIIPYYNTYELTYKLLRELSIQKTNEVEIILVDDSNDARLDVFDEIDIIHFKERKGVSHARNIGINKAKGKYIAFIDSDDMITMDYIERLLNAIDNQNEDIIYFNWADFNENTLNINPQNYAVWKAIYKKEIIPLFNEEMYFNEDVDFQQKIKKKKLSEYFLNRVLYIYNSNRKGSQMWIKSRRDKMIKCEVIKDFTLAKFDELKNIERKGADVYGALKVGDTFECEKEMAEYLTGNNPIKEVVVKILEVEPIEETTEPVNEEIEETIEEVIEPIEDECVSKPVIEEIETEIEEIEENKELPKEKKSNKKK